MFNFAGLRFGAFPAGPKYDRDGSPRRAWYDPVGFAGLDKEPPPPLAAELLLQDCTRLGLRQEELEHVIAEKATELHALGVQQAGMEGNPHLRARHAALVLTIAAQREELSALRKEFSENGAVLALSPTSWPGSRRGGNPIRGRTSTPWLTRCRSATCASIEPPRPGARSASASSCWPWWDY